MAPETSTAATQPNWLVLLPVARELERWLNALPAVSPDARDSWEEFARQQRKGEGELAARLRRMPGCTVETSPKGLHSTLHLAGVSRQPGWTVAAFAAALALWGMLYRSGSWPRRLGDLTRPEVLVTTLALVGVMLALAGLCFLAGRGLSVLTGVAPLPLAMPLAIPVPSLAAALLVQSPRRAAEMDAFLDDALRQLQGLPGAPADPDIASAAEALAARLAALPEHAREDDVRAIIGASGLHDAALLAQIDRMGVPPPRPARLAAVLIVTEPEAARGLADRGEAGWVFDTLRGDPALEALFARRALALLAEAPHLWRDMPYAFDVDEAARSTPDAEAADLLAALRIRLDDLAPLDDDLERGEA